ncbi:MAG: sigma-70 family RNA polymerase sigma factor [Nannocystaceae bacterium]
MIAKATAPAIVGPAAGEGEPYAEALALARQVAAGDRLAAAAFARRLLPVVRRVARALSGPGTDADDAVQTSLVELLESAGTYAGQGALEGWARRITARVTLRALRRGRKRGALPLEDEDVPEDRYDEADLRESIPRPVEAYLAALPEAQRTALLLRHALDHTLPEIAELTGAPVPTVKSRVQKAQETLRRLIRRDLNLSPAPDAAAPRAAGGLP